jgi:hypothetical protein
MRQIVETLTEARTQLTRRLLMGLALVAPFAARKAQAADRVGFADLWSEGAEFSQRAKALKPEVEFTS